MLKDKDKRTDWTSRFIAWFFITIFVYVIYLTIVPSNFIYNVQKQNIVEKAGKTWLVYSYDNFKLRRCPLIAPIQRTMINQDTGEAYNISDTETSAGNEFEYGLRARGKSTGTVLGVVIPPHIPNGTYNYYVTLHYQCNQIDDHVVEQPPVRVIADR